MVAYDFMKQMIEPIQSGRKLHTIRKNNRNNRHAKLGSALQLYNARRTKHAFKILDATCLATYEIDIKPPSVSILLANGWRTLTLLQVDELATVDGFDSTEAFFDYFRETEDRLLIVWGQVTWLNQLIN